MRKYFRVSDDDLKLINRLMGQAVRNLNEMNQYNLKNIFPSLVAHLNAEDIELAYKTVDKAHGACFICKSTIEFRLKLEQFVKACEDFVCLKEKLLIPIPLPKKPKIERAPVKFDFFKYQKEDKKILAVVFVLAILLTPFSLLVTLPLYLNWQKKNYLPDSAPIKTQHLKVENV